LGYAYQKTGQDAEKAAESMEKTVEVAQQLQAMAEASGSRKVTDMTASQWANLTPGAIQQLLNTPGLMNASGAANVQQYQQSQAYESRFGGGGSSQADLAARQQKAEAINVTLQMGDQEIGRVHAILKDRDYQEQRRGGLGSTSTR
jgi:hypothetical protein